ncbi:LysE/ArgO family amino acid transporter [Citricoccus sp.]|uniref:LysE/ArgO family amino acid transporter n=1 Tax=Citricoccus sp. TaxID=1978372 RepID=UPI0026049A2F|nr:LysE family transporter [Citricoccus sp.]HRO28845.1 LysE family transporter [Citricoccus sp.]HRO92311.1 LysE family transporter [Citricoccus sp.]
MTIFLTGLLTCLALIVAIGAQSLFIMRQAIRRDRLMLTLAVCLAGDLVLVFAGTAGVGVVAERAPWVLQVLTWAGVAYLLWFAFGSFRSAFASRRTEPPLPGAGPAGVDGEPEDKEATAVRPRDEDGAGGASGVAVATRPALAVRLRARERASTPVHVVVLTALSVSMLNPHAILDTVVMLGTLANSYGADKWVFAAGAVTGSALWFLTLGLGVRALAPVLDTPRTWRSVDLVVGVVMVAIAAKLALG